MLSKTSFYSHEDILFDSKLQYKYFKIDNYKAHLFYHRGKIICSESWNTSQLEMLYLLHHSECECCKDATKHIYFKYMWWMGLEHSDNMYTMLCEYCYYRMENNLKMYYLRFQIYTNWTSFFHSISSIWTNDGKQHIINMKQYLSVLYERFNRLQLERIRAGMQLSEYDLYEPFLIKEIFKFISL